MKKIKDIRNLGRYKNTETGKEYNIKKGTNIQRGTDVLFFLYRGKRVFISHSDFYSDLYIKIK